MDLDSTEATSNPVAPGDDASNSAKGATFDDMEKALAGLKDGSVTEAEAVRTMEAAVENKFAALIDARLAQPQMLQSVVKAITSKFTEAPTSWYVAPLHIAATAIVLVALL